MFSALENHDGLIVKALRASLKAAKLIEDDVRDAGRAFMQVLPHDGDEAFVAEKLSAFIQGIGDSVAEEDDRRLPAAGRA